ncbi:MAG: hypothetical protein ACLTC4_16475 [Hungatella hathewayi]
MRLKQGRRCMMAVLLIGALQTVQAYPASAQAPAQTGEVTFSPWDGGTTSDSVLTDGSRWNSYRWSCRRAAWNSASIRRRPSGFRSRGHR